MTPEPASPPARTPDRRPGRRLTGLLSAAAVTLGALAPGLVVLTPATSAAAVTADATTTTTAPTLPAVGSTTTTAPPASPPSTSPPPASPPSTSAPKPAPATTSTTVKGQPAVPVGGPTTTAPPANTPPPPPPDPTPVLTAVRDDLAQLSAISDYKPAQALVGQAQIKVTQAGSALQSDRSALAAAQAAQKVAGSHKVFADSQLRSMALAAYVGVGFSTPGFGQPANGNGDQGMGTVSTPGGLTGVEGLDAKEMLSLVGQRARQGDDDAKKNYADSVKAVQAANAQVAAAQATVNSAESALLAAQQTLHQVTAAAITPGTAAATPLPDLSSIVVPNTTPGATTTTTVGGVALTGAVGPGGQLAPPTSPSILGPAVMNAQEIAAWFVASGRQPNVTVPIAQLAQDYQDWGTKTGVRYDLAFAQSVVETGFFSFPPGGQLTATDNNFAGIGACDTCSHGWTFPDAATGVGAQLELLEAYASPTKVDTHLVGPVGVGGCCPTWMALSGKWASNLEYGIEVMTIYNQMLSWLIPQREMAAGLIAGQGADAQGPQLAPLFGCPGSPPPPPPPGAPPTTTTTTTVPRPAPAKGGPAASTTTVPSTTTTTIPPDCQAPAASAPASPPAGPTTTVAAAGVAAASTH